MIRSELNALIAEKYAGLSKADVTRIVDTIFEEMTAALERGHRVELRNFGAFSTRQRDARLGRNPRTGEPVDVEPKAAIHFKCGKELARRLNEER